ncbi:MAG: squalene/phytoene synthase family protein [Devosia sp.]|nr:squalene/phytoene synthase family protein [Devosia sp.]
MAGAVEIVAQTLRTADRDRYFSSLLLREPQRAAVQALLGFNAELAATRSRVRQPALGEIRLQWWIDALSGAGHGGVRDNPIAAALLDAIERYRLPTGPLLRLIEARRFDLYDDAMPDLRAFEGYAGETASRLLHYAAMVLNDGEAVESGDAAGHLGVAQALTGHLRGFGYEASQGRLFLPLSVFAANGLGEGEVFAGVVSEGLLAAHAQLTEIAASHLALASTAILALPVKLRPAFTIFPVIRTQLELVRRANATPFTPPADLADWRKIAMMTAWNWRYK